MIRDKKRGRGCCPPLGKRLQICRVAWRIVQYLLMLSRNNVRDLLGPFHLSLSDDVIDNLLQYLGLLLRWNQKINLTSVRIPEECITRHFGESLLLSKVAPLHGRLLDIGSGAGFPGLAIKLLAPELQVVLLEPVAKKRAFLKEVARMCGMSSVDVVGRRIEEFSPLAGSDTFDIVTSRAVGGFDSLVVAAARLLKHNGWLCLWVGSQDAGGIPHAGLRFQWLNPLPIPLSHGRRILVGRAGGNLMD
jgi:16S rRNA (guanine527-N7)-methyltransferase